MSGIGGQKRCFFFLCLCLPRCSHSQLHLPSQQNSTTIDPYHPHSVGLLQHTKWGYALSCFFLMVFHGSGFPTFHPLVLSLPHLVAFYRLKSKVADHREHCQVDAYWCTCGPWYSPSSPMMRLEPEARFWLWGKSNRIHFWGWPLSVSKHPTVDFNSLLSFLGDVAHHVWVIHWTLPL